MSLIDQRILVAAPIEAIWIYVTDPAQLIRWNLMCKQISVLTTKPGGVGARRRCVTEDGRTLVEQITAWFEHIGYEYIAVDGPYAEYKGRIRLQAVPEGTIINWTIEYRLKGLLAAVRNLLSHKGKLDKMMTDSMRQLRRVVESSGVRLDPSDHARYAMQSAPSVDQRANRQGGASVPDSMRETVMRPVQVTDDDIPEAPIVSTPRQTPVNPAMAAMSDSKPMPSVAQPFAPFMSDSRPMPPLIAESRPMAPVNPAEAAGAPATDKHDTKPRPPQGLRETLISSSRRDRRDQDDDLPVEPSAPTVPISLVAPPPPPEPETQTVDMPAVPTIEPPKTLPEYIPTPPPFSIKDWVEPNPDTGSVTPAPAPFQTEDDTKPSANGVELPTGEDTGQISIWDVFGVERPSEKAQAELEAVIASIQPRPAITRSLPLRQLTRRAKAPVRPFYKKTARSKVNVPVRRLK